MITNNEPQFFSFSSSPLRERVQWISYIGLGVWAAIAIFNWIQHQDPSWGILVGFQVILLMLFWRRIFRPLPSTVCSTSSEIIFHDLPSFWINVQGIRIPLAIKKEFRIPSSTLTLEWISGSLTWNDMQHGKSIFLAHGEQGQALESWLIQQGIRPAVGDK